MERGFKKTGLETEDLARAVQGGFRVMDKRFDKIEADIALINNR